MPRYTVPQYTCKHTAYNPYIQYSLIVLAICVFFCHFSHIRSQWADGAMCMACACIHMHGLCLDSPRNVYQQCIASYEGIKKYTRFFFHNLLYIWGLFFFVLRILGPGYFAFILFGSSAAELFFFFQPVYQQQTFFDPPKTINGCLKMHVCTFFVSKQRPQQYGSQMIVSRAYVWCHTQKVCCSTAQYIIK